MGQLKGIGYATRPSTKSSVLITVLVAFPETEAVRVAWNFVLQDGWVQHFCFTCLPQFSITVVDMWDARAQESGRAAIADAALSDGSSFVCSFCGGVVKKDRESIHYEFWCPARPG